MLAITLIYCKSALSRSLQERIRLSNIDGPLGSPLPFPPILTLIFRQ